jgi:xanthine dehydrogenase YagR molybdenum-binding subunit
MRQVPEVQAAAKPAKHEKYPWPEKPTIIGTKVSRLDGPLKATGRAKYPYDIKRPGMLWGKILRSPHAHARILAIDVSPAEKAPGVKAALAWRKPGEKVVYQGDEVACVAAQTEEQALDALRLIKVQYEQLPHLANVEQAMRPEAPVVFEGGNVKVGSAEENGDLAAGFKAAAHVVENTYSTQVQTHVCLETHGCVVDWQGDTLTAWVSTQAVHGTREGFSKALDIPMNNVRVITEYMGGGFGSKFGPDVQGLMAAQLSKKAAAPVHMMLDRKEEHLVHRPPRASRLVSRPTVRSRRSMRNRGEPAAPAQARVSRCRTSISSRIAAASTKTSSSTAASSARCARPAIHKDASSPKC